ncbi:SMI1/KNR4 family protein [Pectobacterium brasiliense]|uniref:SMI1/KNR4 family protein n=1 Tax=Pectobacterium brasiliense TaxID=180957 RepID=UPI00227AE896|nr:SMI1/KNR4 family protein [Pectobacterium brasiliense]WGL28422.1 SMI1/KNR4 family protein [Pectobacterium brasiliense]
MSAYLYTEDELPEKFKYPSSYIEIMSMDVIPDIEPWSFICEFKESSDFWMREVKGKYPTRRLVPFAKVNYSDDIACFDGADTSGEPKVYYVHAFASSGWEDRGYTDNFTEWLKMARLESARYKVEQAEDDV